MIWAEILKRINALNLSAESHAEILRIFLGLLEPIEEKRKKDRERKARVRGKSGGQSADIHIYKTPTNNKIKRSKYISAAEVAESPQEDNRAFAASKGWPESRIISEWQRFRDYGIQKDRKHRGPLGLAAAWRNWVTSPYQAGPTNAKTARNGLAQALARLGDDIRETERSEIGGEAPLRLLPGGRRE